MPPCACRRAPEATSTLLPEVGRPKLNVSVSELLRNWESGPENLAVVAKRPPTSTTAPDPNTTPPGDMNHTFPP